MKKTKIVCTIGPSSNEKETLIQLAHNGMNVARLNFSHGTHEEKESQLDNVRAAEHEIGQPITILADLQGPKLRLGEIDGKREIKKGETIILAKESTYPEFPTQVDLSEIVKKDERILLNDGLIELKVAHVHENGKVEAVAHNDGWVSSFKGINIPDTFYTKDTFTQKDRSDLDFAVSKDVDYIAMSFVQSAEDIHTVRRAIESHGKSTKIIAKIERKEATQRLEEIIEAADGVMIARGDLAIETSASEVPIIQLQIIRIARQSQKPVIVATQMLESMIENPRPTRAEATDIAHAVLYQVDAIMLSAESATGKYPKEAVKVMSDIISKVEHSPEFKHYVKFNWKEIEEDALRLSAIASTAASITHRIHTKCIVAATATGNTVRILSSFRPEAEIIAVTHDAETRDQLNLLWGVTPLIIGPTDDNETFLKQVSHEVRERNLAQEGDQIVMVVGTKVGVSGETDTVRVITL